MILNLCLYKLEGKLKTNYNRNRIINGIQILVFDIYFPLENVQFIKTSKMQHTNLELLLHGFFIISIKSVDNQVTNYHNHNYKL